tara:strand:+ start:593 stop:1450 length:858 start_codon:yes stop_codon:yes gene_type:complete
MAYVPGLSSQVYRTRLQSDILKTQEAQKRAQEQLEDYQARKAAGTGFGMKAGKFAGKLASKVFNIPEMIAEPAGEYIGGRIGASRDYGKEPDISDIQSKTGTGLLGETWGDLDEREREFDDILKGQIEGAALGTAASKAQEAYGQAQQFAGMIAGVPGMGSGSSSPQQGFNNPFAEPDLSANRAATRDDLISQSDDYFSNVFANEPFSFSDSSNIASPAPVNTAAVGDDIDNMDWSVDWNRPMDEYQLGGLIGMQMGGNIPRYQSGGLLDYILQPMIRDMIKSQG